MFWKIISLLKSFNFFTGSYSVNVFPPPLSPKDEEKYIKMLDNKNIDARNKLIEHNLRLVAHIVKKYEGKNISNDDLISIGTIGLIKGIDSYNSSKNIKITTYAAKCIENEILMYFRSNEKFDSNISLNESIGTDNDGNDISLIDVLPCNDEDIDLKIFKKMNVESLYNYLKILKPREKNIIIRRYGLFGSESLTQKEIAKTLHISRSYVSRIEKRAIIKLYKEFYKKNGK